MIATRALRQAAAQARMPLIKFLGKRRAPESIDHKPRIHPAAPVNVLPDTFAAYRKKAQQHGPLGFHASSPSSAEYGVIGGNPGQSLGPVKPPSGVYFDRSELPARFRRIPWSEAEIEAVESGGASLFG